MASFNMGYLTSLKFEDCVEIRYEWSPWVNWNPEDKIDFLFIDGDHSFIAAIVDYHYFNYFVNKGGLIGFHDVNIKGVRDAIDTIKERDKIEYLETADRLELYKKSTAINEKYFQLLASGTNRERLHEL
jgi:predicted O-methyltransferase YrrM